VGGTPAVPQATIVRPNLNVVWASGARLAHAVEHKNVDGVVVVGNAIRAGDLRRGEELDIVPEGVDSVFGQAVGEAF